jgi:anti-sigma factor RsiW
MTRHDDASGFGCPAFGHLASAFVDHELPQADLDRYATHLPGCGPCQALCAQYRALDVAAMPPYPRPTEGEWDAAWSRIARRVEEDRAEAARSPAGAFLRWLEGFWPRTPWAGPLAAAAAAAVVIGLTLALHQSWEPSGRPQGVPVASSRPVRATATVASTMPGGAQIMNVTCQPGWEAVVWTIGGDDPSTVVQCQPVEI